jgi:hypothetical protein
MNTFTLVDSRQLAYFPSRPASSRLVGRTCKSIEYVLSMVHGVTFSSFSARGAFTLSSLGSCFRFGVQAHKFAELQN